jgi:hypothetical protein
MASRVRPYFSDRHLPEGLQLDDGVHGPSASLARRPGGRAPFVGQPTASFLWSNRSHDVVRSWQTKAEWVLGPRYLESRGGRCLARHRFEGRAVRW